MKRYIMAIATALSISSTHSIANIHDPHNSFLLRKLPNQNELNNPGNQSATNQEREYFKKVVGDTYGKSESEITTLTLAEWKEENGFNIAKELTKFDSTLLSELLPSFSTEDGWDVSLAGPEPSGYGFLYRPSTRTGLSKISVDYFNSGDLGLGRRMNCVRQTIDVKKELITNNTIKKLSTRGGGAMACYVSNYGAIGGSIGDNFQSFPQGEVATAGEPEAFATVAMEIWPEANENKVRFFVFAESGNGSPSVEDDTLVYLEAGNDQFTPIKLDNGGGHSQPGICLSCHGGSFTGNGVVDGAHFLPFDRDAFRFADENGATATADLRKIKEVADKKFAALNLWILDAERQAYHNSDSTITSDVAKYIINSQDLIFTAADQELPTITGTSHLDDSILLAYEIQRGLHLQDENYIPEEFNNNEADIEIHENIYAPYCRGCHLAVTSPITITPAITVSYLCSQGQMPHAEVNMRNILNATEKLEPLALKYCTNTNLPSLLDFESEEINGESTYFHNTFTSISKNEFIGVSSTIGQLIKNTQKRTLQTPSNRGNVTIRLAHEVDSAQKNEADMTGGQLKSLAFQYYLDGNDRIEVTFKKQNIVTETRIIRNSTTNPVVKFTHFNPNNPNDRDYGLFRTAKLQIPAAGASHVDIRMINSNSSPVEIDDILADFDSNYTIAVDSGPQFRVGVTTGVLAGGPISSSWTCSNPNQRFPSHPTIISEREPTRGPVSNVWSIPRDKFCIGGYYETRSNLTFDQLGIDPSKPVKIIVAFDYHADKNATLSARINSSDSHNVATPTNNLMGLSQQSSDNKVGRMRFAVPQSYMDSSPGSLGIVWRHTPLSLNNSNAHLNNLRVYVKQ